MSLEATMPQEEAAVAPTEHTRGGSYYRPNVDIFELPGELAVKADMPGAKMDAIDIQFDDGSLTIHAHLTTRQDLQGPFSRKEYGVGDYYRTFRVSEQIDASRISAEYSAGILTLHLPKTEAVKPRKIQVEAK
jgi:HSP20 family protein